MKPSETVADLVPADPTTPGTDGGLQLAGSRCDGCGQLAFPARAVCHRCGRRSPTPSAVGGTGTLYSWTTVHVSTSGPTPYDVGYVDLPGLRVFGRLAGSDHGWEIGARLRVRASDEPQGWAFVADEAVPASAAPTGAAAR